MTEQVPAPAATAPQVVHLVSPNIPADQGLSSLGLLLQLAGSLSAAFACFTGFLWLWASVWMGGGAMIGILLIGTLSVIRSFMHRAAGTELLYGPQPLRGVRRYAVVGLAHSVLLAALLMSPLYHVPVRSSVAIGVACAVWPVLLLLLLRLPRFRRYEEELPLSEDKGFEGAAVLMTILGLAGLGVGSSILWSMLHTAGSVRGLGALLVLVVGLLVIRSVVHVRAGLGGLSDTPLDLAAERAGNYATLGIVSALITSAVMFLTVVGSRADFSAILAIAVIGWVLAAWPMILRRYFAERQFASLLAGNDAPVHRRAPDAGLTALGWLLIGAGGAQASLAVLGVLGGASDLRVISSLLPASDGSAWIAALIAVAHVGAGFELVRMSPHHRAVVTGVGGITLLLQLSALWPTWRQLARFGSLDPAVVATLGMALVPMVTGGAMIALVQRKLTPMARASIRSARR